jgi:hypothetical protein
MEQLTYIWSLVHPGQKLAHQPEGAARRPESAPKYPAMYRQRLNDSIYQQVRAGLAPIHSTKLQ